MNNLEQKLYQLIISRIDGEKLSSDSYQEQAVALVQKGLGGFILFGGKKEAVKGFVDMVQSVAGTPLFIASDIERGAGQQIEGATRLPGQMAIAAAVDRAGGDGSNILEDAVGVVAEEALDIGINMPLIPVLDVNRNPDNPIICTRAFSDNPEDVAWFGRQYIRVLEDEGLISCAKHFPGHGDTDIDSHISLPVISKPLNELMDTDIFPFREAIEAGVSSIMAGHLSIPAVDDMPASLSEKVITGLLRNELCYEGLILTDALNMHALKETGNVPVRCINAGADILLHPADADAVVDELKQAVAAGELKETKIDEAVERILKHKTALKDLRKATPDYNRNMEVSVEISERSVTCVKDTPGVLPLADIQSASLVFAGDENDFDMTQIKGLFSGDAQCLRAGEISPENTSVSGTVVFALFTSVAAWKGSSGIREEEVAIIRELIKKSGRSVVVSFGSPYVLRHFREADVLIAAYDPGKQAQLSVIKCLKGERECMGSLPVDLSLS